jgi:hypothetical protein
MWRIFNDPPFLAFSQQAACQPPASFEDSCSSQAVLRHRPGVPGVDITVVASTELVAGLSADPTLWWGALTSGRVTVRQVPDDHLSMLRPPNVALVAEELPVAATGR